MSTLFKKIASVAGVVAITYAAIAPATGSAMYTDSVQAANALAKAGVIVDQSSNISEYRLGDTITRREMIKVAMQLASCQGVEVADVCDSKFADLNGSDWGCKYAESALSEGIVSANTYFRPNDNVSKAEALKMIMQASNVAVVSDDDWRLSYVKGGVAANITDSFSDYNTSALRGWIFRVAASALEVCENDTTTPTTPGEDDILCQLLGICEENPTNPTDPTTPVTPISGSLQVALSPNTPAGTTIPGGVNGLPVVTFDFTAGSKDVTITSLRVRREGISSKDTLTGVAAFTSEGRISRERDDNEGNNNEATISINGGLVIPAGKTVPVTLVASVGSVEGDARVEADEFSLRLIGITSDVAEADVTISGTPRGETFRVGSRDAAQLTVTSDGTVVNPKIGDRDAEIFKFRLRGSANEDIEVKSLTFRTTNSNAADDLVNFKLKQGTNVVASTTSMNGRYVTFNLTNPVTIRKSGNERFVVTADVVAGANDELGFYVDKELDISANGLTYGYGASINISDANDKQFGTIQIKAGELVLTRIQPAFDEIKEGKTDVELGRFKVNNVSGGSIELQEFGVKLAPTYGTARDAGSSTTYTRLDQVFERFELYNVKSGQSFTLDLNNATNVYSDRDINIVLANGETEFILRADTRNNIDNFDTFEFTMSLEAGKIGANGGFYAVEMDDDTVVDDVTPSVLSWNRIEGTESGATVATVPLAHVSKVRGATKVPSLDFEIKADRASDLKFDELVAKVLATTNSVYSAGSNGTSTIAAPTSATSYTETNVTPSSTTFTTGKLWTINVNGIEYTYTGPSTAYDADDVAAGIYALLPSSLKDTTPPAGNTVNIKTSPSNVSTSGEFDRVGAGTPTTVHTTVFTITGADTAGRGYSVNVAGTNVSFQSASTTAGTATNLVTAVNNAAIPGTTATSNDSVVTIRSSSPATVTFTAPTSTSVAANSQIISQVSLYLGDVNGRLIDSVSGSSINTSTGEVTFSFSPVTIDAGQTEGFTIAVDIVDSSTAEGKTIKTELVRVSLDDEEGDDINPSSPVVGLNSTGIITVVSQGSLVVTADANNIDNEYNKTILGGNNNKVYSIDVQATNESVRVRDVLFTVNSADIKSAVTSATLLLDGNTVATTNNSNITVSGLTSIVKFADLDRFVIEQKNSELVLQLNTATIGHQKVGKVVKDAEVTAVSFERITGVDSGKAVANNTVSSSTGSKKFTIAPVTLTPSVSQSLSTNNNQAKIKLTATVGGNTVPNSNSTPSAKVSKLTFSAPGATATSYELYREGTSGTIATATVSGTTVTFDFTTGTNANVNTTVSSDTTFVITPVTAAGEVATLNLVQNGVEYTAVTTTLADGTTLGQEPTWEDITINLESELNFGTRTHQS